VGEETKQTYVVTITRDTKQRMVARWRDFRGWKNSRRLTKMLEFGAVTGLREPREGKWGVSEGRDMPLWLKKRWEAVLRCMKERDYINDSEKRAIKQSLVCVCGRGIGLGEGKEGKKQIFSLSPHQDVGGAYQCAVFGSSIPSILSQLPLPCCSERVFIL
jgi:hypothetical protein